MFLMDITDNTSNPVSKFQKLFENKKLIYILSGIIVVLLVLITSAIFILSNNQTPQNNSNANTQQQTQDDLSAFLPAQTCPDEFTNVNNSLGAKLNGQTYLIRGEDTEWLNQNCKNISSSSSSNGKGLAGYTSQQCEGSGSVPYTSALMRIEDVGLITPLGRMFDSHVTPTDHQYWQPADMNAGWNDYTIYAPADGFITGIGRKAPGVVTTVDLEVTATEVDYRVVIEHTCDFSTILIHMHDISASILSQVTFDEKGNAGIINIPVKAGDAIATVGGNSFDVTTVDLTKKLTGFVNEQTYIGEPWKIYTAPTIAYYNEPLRSQYYSKVSRSAEPVDGKIDYDKDGYLVGNWFREGANGYVDDFKDRYWDSHLSIAYWQNNPEFIIVSTGHFIDGKSAQFMVDPNSPDPANVDSNSGMITYNLYNSFQMHADGTFWDLKTPAKDLILEKNGEIQGKIFLQIMPDKTLKAEIVTGNSNQTGFSGAAQIYTR